MINALSIIIPTLNEERYLPSLLKSIAAQKFGGKLEVIVVDGGSTDGTIAAAEDHRHQIGDLTVITARRGPGAQRNAGATQAKYDYVLFVDADVIIPPGVLERVARRIKDGRPFIAAIRHVTARMTIVDRIALIFTYALFFIAHAVRLPVTNGDFILTTKENHFRLAKGFVEGALLGEDTDYGIRSFRAGARYMFIARAHIIASDRRVREMGWWRLVLLWSRAFVHVIRHGPIFPGHGVEYPFGHYHQVTDAATAPAPLIGHATSTAGRS